MFVIFGCLIFWLGWLGFNGGLIIEFKEVGYIIIIIIMFAVIGGIIVILFSLLFF